MTDKDRRFKYVLGALVDSSDINTLTDLRIKTVNECLIVFNLWYSPVHTYQDWYNGFREISHE